MLIKKLFAKEQANHTSQASAAPAATRQAPPMPAAWAEHGAAMWDTAVALLLDSTSPFRLDDIQARVVLAHMHPFEIEEGVTFIREDDDDSGNFLALVIDGEVTVETIAVSRTTSMTVTVLGPGSIHGELGLLDNAPRSASCTACTPVLCGILTREGYARLLHNDPESAARFTAMVALHLGQRLRDNTEKLKRYGMLARAMQEEIERLAPSRH